MPTIVVEWSLEPVSYDSRSAANVEHITKSAVE